MANGVEHERSAVRWRGTRVAPVGRVADAHENSRVERRPLDDEQLLPVRSVQSVRLDPLNSLAKQVVAVRVQRGGHVVRLHRAVPAVRRAAATGFLGI